ncbi:right-handed parallel beta-helix repeat-containing protein [Paenibacillus psychroresistens]|nr:right-handed parallel beta-helix repeat-containing protein [Paenibacillus psychroresistens]
MKKGIRLSIFPSLILLMAISTILFFQAAAADDIHVKSEAQVVADLGILIGDGKGLTTEYLQKPTTRIQSVILFLRLKGLEAEALKYTGTVNFDDAKLVWADGQKILGYVKANPQFGWLGLGNNTFDPQATITAQQYYKVMLETLGYKQDVDYDYVNVLQFAGTHGLSRVANNQPFSNANVATATLEALNAQVHDAPQTLAVQLTEAIKLDASRLEPLHYSRIEWQTSASVGSFLTDAQGLTLYYTKKNATQMNACDAGCLKNWPVFYADKLLIPADLDVKDFGAFKRADGIKQTTYKGYPLYYGVHDLKRGDITGQGVDNEWHAVNSTPLKAIAAAPTVTALPAKYLQVKDFGAAGNGVKDDTAAIQAAVNKAGELGGATVYFPKGVYILKNTIMVEHDNITLEGVGWEAELRLMVHPQRVITIKNAKHSVVRNLQVSLGLSGVLRNDSDEGIYVAGKSTDFLIEKVLGNAKGIMVRGDITQGIIRDNSIKNSLADGIHITNGANNINITNNTLENTGDDAIAVVSYVSGVNYAYKINIVSNHIKNSRARGIAHVGGKNVNIFANTIEGTSSSGILVDQDRNYNTFPSYNTNIEDNTITGAGSYALQRGNEFGIEVASNTFGTSIKSNLIQNGVFRGIGVSADKTIIRFNRILKNAETGIQVDANEVILEGNRLELNGKYGIYSSGRKGLVVLNNALVNNNALNYNLIDNLKLIDINDAQITDNKSIDTRVPSLVERPYQLLGSCKNLVFTDNTSSGTKQAELIQCKP